MDRSTRRNGLIWACVTLGLCSLPACSDVSSPAPVVSRESSSSSDHGAAGAVSRWQDQDRESGVDTSSVVPASHLFAPPPVPTVDEYSGTLAEPQAGDGDQQPVVRVAPPMAEPRELPDSIRRLPETEPVMVHGALDAAPSDEPALLPAPSERSDSTSSADKSAAGPESAARRLPDPSAGDPSLIRRLPPVIEEPEPQLPDTADPTADPTMAEGSESAFPTPGLDESHETELNGAANRATDVAADPAPPRDEAAADVGPDPIEYAEDTDVAGDAPLPAPMTDPREPRSETSEMPLWPADESSRDTARSTETSESPQPPMPEANETWQVAVPGEPATPIVSDTGPVVNDTVSEFPLDERVDPPRRLPAVDDESDLDYGHVQLAPPTFVPEAPVPPRFSAPERQTELDEPESVSSEFAMSAARPERRRMEFPVEEGQPDVNEFARHAPSQLPPAAHPDPWKPVAVPVRPLAQQAIAGESRHQTMHAVIQRKVDSIALRAEDLASRGAYFSARAEMIKALRIVTQSLDAQHGSTQHSKALGKAMRAMKEAGDFAPRGSKLEAHLNLSKLVSGHRTPVLKGERLEHMTAVYAQQLYLEYAQQQFMAACAGMPSASRAIYGLARIYAVLDRAKLDTQTLCLPKAVALHQAALLVDPNNSLAANELGVLLARFGQLEDARRVLLHSVSVQPEPEAWHNLSVVHQRLGEAELARRAHHQSEIIAAQREPAPSDGPHQSVQWVDPKAFSEAPPALGQ